MSDFASEYGIRLAREDPGWGEFCSLLTGLLSADTRVWRYFQSDDEDGG